MFGKKKEGQKVIVRTKEELKAAVKRKEPCIEVQGDLANKMKWMGKLSKKKVAALTVVLAAATFNPLAAGSAAAVQGVLGMAEGGAAILLIRTVGVATILAMIEGYNMEVEVSLASAGSFKIRLTKK